jgi:hypothetical protein
MTNPTYKPYTPPENRSVWIKLLSALPIPFLLVLAFAVPVVCFLVWWDIYGYYAFKGAYGALYVLAGWVQYGN